MHCIMVLCMIGFCTLLQEPERADTRFFFSFCNGIDISNSTSSFTFTSAAAQTTMQVDAVGESTQRHAHIPAPTHAASSDDCSAVNLPSSTSAQDGAKSHSAQHAQHGTAQDSSAHYQVPAGNPSMSPFSHRSSHRTFRKRKQPDQSLPPPLQAQQEAVSSSLDNISRAEKSILDGMPHNIAKPDSLASVLSRRKGKRKGSKASEGQSPLEGSEGNIRSVHSSGTGTGAAARVSICQPQCGVCGSYLYVSLTLSRLMLTEDNA